jgi:phosphosulfolactate synthase (CoM biosynthesis protein A)
MKELLTLPARADKPRERGITHILDRGLSVVEIDSLVEVAGDYIDFVKLGWGTAVATLNLQAKLDRYREHGLPVMFGGTLTELMAPYRWVEQIEAELEAGAWKVIAEARESGAVGIFRHDGEVRQGLVDEILHAIPGDQIIFEAPRKDQQVWFVRRLGPDANLGNIAPEEVLSLETIRLGLRADTAVAAPEIA